MASDRDSTYGSLDREEAQESGTRVTSTQMDDANEIASEGETQQSVNARIRRNWRPPYVEIPGHDQGSTSRDSEDENDAPCALPSRAPSP